MEVNEKILELEEKFNSLDKDVNIKLVEIQSDTAKIRALLEKDYSNLEKRVAVIEGKYNDIEKDIKAILIKTIAWVAGLLIAAVGVIVSVVKI